MFEESNNLDKVTQQISVGIDSQTQFFQSQMSHSKLNHQIQYSVFRDLCFLTFLIFLIIL